MVRTFRTLVAKNRNGVAVCTWFLSFPTYLCGEIFYMKIRTLTFTEKQNYSASRFPFFTGVLHFLSEFVIGLLRISLLITRGSLV